MGGFDRLPSLALLAGGLATRLRPITTTIPKSMVEVAGEPFIAHQLRLLVREGITDAVICAGYLGEQIEAFVGDGTSFGCHVRYSYDGKELQGTGGALARALPYLGGRCFVMYGDSYLDTPFRSIYETFLNTGLPALMTVFQNKGQWDASNIEFADGVIRRYDKVNRTPEMHYIDYGLSVLNTSIVSEWMPKGRFDLADLYRDLVDRHLLAGYEVPNRFYEIGSPTGLKETDALLRAKMQNRTKSNLTSRYDGEKP